MDELTYENATHLLSCAHQMGWRNGKPNGRREYSMRCHILKDMGDGRCKILVFGERDWKGKEHISHVRYVPKSRLTRRALDGAIAYCQHISENIDGTCPYCDLPKPPAANANRWADKALKGKHVKVVSS